MGNSNISMAMFNSYVKLPEGSFWGIATFRIMQLGCVILGWWYYLRKRQEILLWTLREDAARESPEELQIKFIQNVPIGLFLTCFRNPQKAIGPHGVYQSIRRALTWQLLRCNLIQRLLQLNLLRTRTTMYKNAYPSYVGLPGGNIKSMCPIPTGPTGGR